MGATGRGSLSPAMGGGNLQDSREDIPIRNQNDSGGSNNDESRENKQHNLIDKRVSTGDLVQG
jgi:hypothetical protein